MISLIIILSTVVAIVSVKAFELDIDSDALPAVIAAIAFIGAFVMFTMLIFYPYTVDKKILMYEEENKKIEEKVKDTVRVYMNYEQETYNNLVKDADLTTLLVVYPDLNSNELVKSEINVYIENSKTIKEMKSTQLTKSILNWWLYFGK